MKMKIYPEAPTPERIKLIFDVHRMKQYDFEKFYGIPLTHISHYMSGRMKVPQKYRHVFFDPPKALVAEFEKRFEMNQKAMRAMGLKDKKHNRYKNFSKKEKVVEDVKEQKIEVKRIGVLADLLSSSSAGI